MGADNCAPQPEKFANIWDLAALFQLGGDIDGMSQV